jgi:hypothetical protein
LEKNIGIEKHAGKVRKIHSFKTMMRNFEYPIVLKEPILAKH